MDLVSVIIPAYNQAHYLGRAIQSVLAQTYSEFEIIVVNDGSSDNTSSVVEAISDPRMHYIYQDNKGLSGARNTGIRVSRGAYISYLDADDEFLPGKLSALIGVIKKTPEVGLAAGQAIPVDEEGQQIGSVFNRGIPEDHSELLLSNPLHVGSVLVSAEWQRVAGFFDEKLNSYEDWDMWLRLARAGCKMAWIDQPVSLYRFHPHQMTRDGRRMTEANFAVLERVFSDKELPKSWRAQEDLAYSNAYLRASAHCYLEGDFGSAKENVLKAVALDPGLLENEALPLRERFSAWTDLPKTDAPLIFLENIYSHLPEEISPLVRPRNALSEAAMGIAFRAFQDGDFQLSREAVWRAVSCKPSWLLNRGVIAIFLKSLLLSLD
jgi:glycosyltransferase involved in cell wall biosynthesis